MEITIIASHNAPHQRSHQAAMARGMEKIGINAIIPKYPNRTPRTKHVACWGWRKGRVLRQQGYEVLVMERGYIGDRFKLTSLGWNGLNGYAEFPDYVKQGMGRFHQHGGVILPWRTKGEYILILGQVPGDASLQGKDLIPWYREQAKKAKEVYGLPVYFRPHPDCLRKGVHQEIEGTIKSEGTLQAALSGALFTIAYNSNSCLDSVLNGIPCVAGDKGTMAYDLCSYQMNDLRRPDREGVLSSIAWTQWSMEEIESGDALKKLVEMKL